MTAQQSARRDTQELASASDWMVAFQQVCGSKEYTECQALNNC